MLDQCGVIPILTAIGILFAVFKNLERKKRKLLESVYNPLLKATYILQDGFEKDKANTRQHFENFNSACLDVTHKYKHLIYQDTNLYFHQLYKAKKILDGTDTEENLGNLGGSISALHGHLEIKIKEIKKKPLLRFFII